MNPKRPINSSHRWFHLLLSVVMILSLLAGCRLPWQTPSNSTGLDPSDQDTEQGSVPTALPRADLPPALVEVSPLPNGFIKLNQPISLYFNQPMDTGSVEAAVHFEPRVSGRFTWENDQIVTFTPDRALAPDSTLQLTVNTSAQAANSKKLQDAIDLNFQTAESLKVVQTMPSDSAQDVDPESVVFVAFNQPVVALGAEMDSPPGFTLSPEVSGEGKWLNTSTFVFTPEISMDGGTVYTIQINELLVATSGSTLAAGLDLRYSFTTTRPVALQVLPLSDKRLSLDGPIEIDFNIRMDKESVEENFSLVRLGGINIPGEFDWDESLKKMAFYPDANLLRNTTYTIRLGSGAKSYGGLPIEAAIETERITFPSFSVDTVDSPEFNSYYGDYGQYSVTFSTPVERSGWNDHITVSPDVSGESTFLSEGDTVINLSGYFKPETNYTITLSAGLQDKWGGRLGTVETYTFLTPSMPPSLSLVTGLTSHDLVFVPASASELIIQATNINTVNLEISPISINDLITLLHPENFDYRQVFLPANLDETTHALNLTNNTNEVISLPLTYQGDPLMPGIYYVGMSSPDLESEGAWNYRKFYLIVSDNNLVMKISPDQAIVWATELSDYSPLNEVPVLVYTTEGEIITSGRTDRNGLFVSEISLVNEPYTNFFAIVGDPNGDDFGFSISTWGQTYRLFEMGILLDTVPAQTDAYIYTDRPIYRPGDTVHFRSAVFARDNGIPIPSDFDSVSISIYGDPGMSGISDRLYSEDLALSQFGTVDGSVTIPDDAPTGMYRIEIVKDDLLIKVHYFDVAAYRKPEIEVDIELNPSETILGKDVNAKILADYYLGLPASGQTVSWTLFRETDYFDLPGYQVGPLDTSWLQPRNLFLMPFGTQVSAGEGTTDDVGLFNLRLTDDDFWQNEQLMGSLQKYTLEATVMAESGFPVSERETLFIHPEEFYIGVQPDAHYGRAESPINFSILTVNWNKQSIGEIPVEATFDRIEWEVVETLNPEMPYEYIAKTTSIASASPVSGPDGRAVVSFTPPEPGTYQLTLESGNALTQVLIWVGGSGRAVWPHQTQNQINLTPDLENYQPGQIAQIFFPNPFRGSAKALITVERGRVMESQILDVEDAGATISVPITAESIPNIYISVILLGKNENGAPDFREGMINLPVSPLNKNLNVELSMVPTEIKPGERVSAILKITDLQGNPVQGEFSLVVVDKALLALVEPTSLPILEAFYGEQPLSVQTSVSLKTYATQLSLSAMDAGLGGGGDMMAQPVVREDFPDTAFWQADVITGADGTARLEIPMPDSLTTWVVEVRGLTTDYLVGQTEEEVLAQKDLMIQPVTPRFLVDGDKVEMAAVVYNNTLASLDVDVSLQGNGFTLDDAAPQTQRVMITPGDSTRVSWWGTVESVESVDLVFEAVSGHLTDSSRPVWGDLQVMRYSIPYTFSTAGQLSEKGQRLELVSLPISIDPSSGDLSLNLTPSLTATLVEGLQTLETGRYSDTASILSRLMANLNAYLALNNLGIESPQLQSNLATLVDDGIRQLLEAQNIDGGWSWWAKPGAYHSTSDPFLTAYVLIGLQQASDAGISVGEHFIDRTVDYLVNQMTLPGEIENSWMLDRLAFQTYALRNSNLDLEVYISGLYARRSELSPWATALLALTISEKDGTSSRVNTLLNDLESRGIRSATGVNWESSRVSWLLPGTPIYNTAVVVFALSQLDPASMSLSPAVQYLMVHRRADGLWSSIFETAWVLMAITEAMQGTGDYQADFDFQATLNDLLIAEGRAESSTLLTSVSAETSIAALHPNAPNALLIERGEGAGTLYYRVDLQTYQPAADAEAISRGISLQRDYYPAGAGCPGADDCRPIDSLVLDSDDPTQVITVALSITVSHDMVNFMLEDFFPAGTEVVNRQFLTSQTLPQDSVPEYNPRNPFENGWGWWHFNPIQIYDDHILWTADHLPAGTYVLTYELLPYQRGVYQVLPTHAWQYFYPEVQGTSSGDIFTIE